MVTYVHHVPGRLRVKAALLKGDPDAAEALRRELAALPGMIAATANPVTGSLILHYRHRDVDADSLWVALRRLGLVDGAAPQDRADRPRPADPLLATMAPRLLKALIEAMLELAVSRSAARLVASLL